MKFFSVRPIKFREKYVDTLYKLYDYSTTVYGNRKMSSILDADISYTYSSFKSQCEELSLLLTRYGIGAGDKVAILSQNHPNWTVAFFSIVPFGRVAIPMLPDISGKEVENIVNHSETKVIFISRKYLNKLSDTIKDKLTLIIDIETFEVIKKDDESFTFDGRIIQPYPHDVATIIYTSGTTGSAKGVMLSHKNLCSSIMASYHTHQANSKDVWLSILPMAHTYELSIGVLYPFFVGGQVYYISKPPTASVLLKALKMVRPTIMLSVPLIIEKMYRSSIVPTIKKSKFLTKLNKNFPLLLHRLIGFKLKKTFGGRLKFFGVGGAKMDPVVETFLKKAHFPYAIGYGLTETSPLICGANPKQTHIGSTGGAVYGVKTKLIDVNPETGEGELVVKGDNVMLGYYKDPERTRGVFTEDGWFRTSDLARMDEKGRYYIMGRLSNLILSSTGENIYPEEIEKVINDIEDVNESIVLERNGRLVALIQFNEDAIDWNYEGEEQFYDSLESKKTLIMNYVNKHVSKFSNINQVEVVKEPFEKTATQKIRRFLYENTVGVASDRNKKNSSPEKVDHSQEKIDHSQEKKDSSVEKKEI